MYFQNPNQDVQNTVSPPFSPSDSSPPPLSPGHMPPTQQQLPSAATQVNNQYVTSSNVTAYNNQNNHYDATNCQHSKSSNKVAEKGWASFEDDDQGKKSFITMW